MERKGGGVRLTGWLVYDSRNPPSRKKNQHNRLKRYELYLVFDGGDGAAEKALHECGWEHEVPSSTSHVKLR